MKLHDDLTIKLTYVNLYCKVYMEDNVKKMLYGTMYFFGSFFVFW